MIFSIFLLCFSDQPYSFPLEEGGALFSKIFTSVFAAENVVLWMNTHNYTQANFSKNDLSGIWRVTFREFLSVTKFLQATLGNSWRTIQYWNTFLPRDSWISFSVAQGQNYYKIKLILWLILFSPHTWHGLLPIYFSFIVLAFYCIILCPNTRLNIHKRHTNTFYYLLVRKHTSLSGLYWDLLCQKSNKAH